MCSTPAAPAGLRAIISGEIKTDYLLLLYDGATGFNEKADDTAIEATIYRRMKAVLFSRDDI
jgi:hypothetical protein